MGEKIGIGIMKRIIEGLMEGVQIDDRIRPGVR